MNPEKFDKTYLISFCKKNNLNIKSKMKKFEIIDIIRENNLEKHEDFSEKNYRKYENEKIRSRSLTYAINNSAIACPLLCIIV